MKATSFAYNIKFIKMTAAREGFIMQKERYPMINPVINPVINLINKNLEHQPPKSLNTLLKLIKYLNRYAVIPSHRFMADIVNSRYHD